MSATLAIRAANLTKRYRIRTQAANGSRRKLTKHWYTALDAVDLEVRQSEVVGVIGRNGAGKSTLLKVLSRITAPSGGEVELWGRVGSLLEVGTGFHPELTGRENVFLNGAILGMKRPEIQARFDGIVDFADIGPFLDTPVKRYSSGMHVRLAFAVAAHLDPDILIVDEVLAVGDAEFQRRCLGKLNEVATEEGRTVLFVSHNMASIEHLCGRVVFLENGKVAFDGEPSDAITRYLAAVGKDGEDHSPGVFSTDGNHVTRVTVTDGHNVVSQLLTGQPVKFVLDVKDLANVRAPMVALRVRTTADQLVFSANTRMSPLDFDADKKSGKHQIELHIPDLPLIPGRYWVDIDVKDLIDASICDRLVRAAELDVVGALNVYGSGFAPRPIDGLVYVNHEWSISPVG